MNKILAERIKKLRTDSELSQAKFAIILGVVQGTVAAWEVGRAEPSSEMLIRLATYFDVTVDYLIGKSNSFYHDDHADTTASVGGHNSGIIGGKNNQIKKK